MNRKLQQPLHNLSFKLRQIRALLGLTEGEMIERLGCVTLLSEHDIRAYERGRREPPLSVLLRYARVASLPLDLLADDDLKMPERLPVQGAPREGECPYCRSTEAQVKAGPNSNGSQRFLCQPCRRRYTPGLRPVGHPDELRKKAVLLHQGGKSPWYISQEIGVSELGIDPYSFKAPPPRSSVAEGRLMGCAHPAGAYDLVREKVPPARDYGRAAAEGRRWRGGGKPEGKVKRLPAPQPLLPMFS